MAAGGQLGLPNVRAYTAVIRSQGGQWQLAVSLLRDLKMEMMEADVIVHNAAMSVCSRAFAWEPVLAILESLEEQQLQGDLISYSICISACSKADEWQHAVQLLRRLDDSDQQADLWIYSAAIIACGRGEHWQQSVALLSKMQKEELEADVVAYSAVISSCATSGEWQQALGSLEAMHRQQLQGDTVLANSVLNALAQTQRWQQAMSFMGKEVDGFASSALIKGASVARNWQVCLSLHISSLGSFHAVAKELPWQRSSNMLCSLQQHSFQADQVTGNTIVAACTHWEDAIRCLFGLHWFKEDVKAYTATLEQCARAPKEDVSEPWRRGVQLICSLKERQVRADVGFWSMVSSLGRWQQTLSMVEQSNLPSFAAFVRESPWQVSLKLLEERRKRSPRCMPLDDYNAAMTTCHEAEEWQVALEVFKSLQENEQLPDSWTYTAAITACGTGHQWQQAEVLVSRMQDEALELDLASYSAALSCCASSQRWEVAMMYFEQMQNCQLQVDEIGYSALIRALVKGDRRDR